MPCLNHPGAFEGLERCWFCAETFCPDCLVRLGGKRYCIHCKTEYVRELVSGLEAVPIDLAHPAHRLAATLVDAAYLVSPWLLLFDLLDLGEIGPAFLWFGFPALLSIEWAIYEAIFLSRGGQTPGKMALQIKVVNPRGLEIGTGQAIGRAATRGLLGAVSVLLLALDLLPALTSRERTCFHDLAAGTRVVDWR